MTLTGDAEPRGADAFHRGQTDEAEGDLESARKWYREAAEAGDRAAAVVLGGLLASDSVGNYVSGTLGNYVSETPQTCGIS